MNIDDEFASHEECESREARKKAQAVEKAQWAKDLTSVASTPQGRRVLAAIAENFCGVFATSFAGESPFRSAFLEGRRSVGIALIAELQREAPELYATMASEQLEAFVREALEERRTEAKNLR